MLSAGAHFESNARTQNGPEHFCTFSMQKSVCNESVCVYVGLYVYVCSVTGCAPTLWAVIDLTRPMEIGLHNFVSAAAHRKHAKNNNTNY